MSRRVRRVVVGWGLLLWMGFVFAGCGEPPTVSLKEKIKHEQPGPSAAREGSFRRIRQHDTVPVTEFDVRPFWTIARTPELDKFPCSSCHTGTQQITGTVRRAHWDRELNHGEARWMKCGTCHDPENMDVLRMREGDTVSFNRVYRLCGQCHFQQERDWAGGAHGKQDQYWGTPRVVLNCTSCHNPHDPDYEKRWPVTFPNIPRTQKDK